MIKRYIIATILVLSFALVLPMSAQDDTAQDTIPVSGTFNYTPAILAEGMGGDTIFFDAIEDEVWIGDFEGVSAAPFRAIITPDGAWDAWIVAEFEGSVLDEYTGTMTVVSRYQRFATTAHWFGEWVIISGTGDLANIHGHGTAWGPGFNPEDPEAGPDIYYSGEVIFVNTATEE